MRCCTVHTDLSSAYCRYADCFHISSKDNVMGWTKMVRLASFTKTNAVYYVNSNAALVKITFRAVSCHKIGKLSIFFLSQWRRELVSGCKWDEVQGRHPPDWSVVVWEWCKQVCWRRLDLISDLWDLPQQSLSFLTCLQDEAWPISIDHTTATKTRCSNRTGTLTSL